MDPAGRKFRQRPVTPSWRHENAGCKSFEAFAVSVSTRCAAARRCIRVQWFMPQTEASVARFRLGLPLFAGGPSGRTDRSKSRGGASSPARRRCRDRAGHQPPLRPNWRRVAATMPGCRLRRVMFAIADSLHRYTRRVPAIGPPRLAVIRRQTASSRG